MPKEDLPFPRKRIDISDGWDYQSQAEIIKVAILRLAGLQPEELLFRGVQWRPENENGVIYVRTRDTSLIVDDDIFRMKGLIPTKKVVFCGDWDSLGVNGRRDPIFHASRGEVGELIAYEREKLRQLASAQYAFADTERAIEGVVASVIFPSVG